MTNPFINLTANTNLSANTAQNARLLTGTTGARISDYVVIKQTPKVITQNPAPGTPVLEGMTIEVKAVSFSDVPYHVLDEAQAVQQARNIPIADIEKVILNDDRLKNAVRNGGIPENDRGVLTEKLNAELGKAGLSGAMSPDDADRLIKQIADFGIVDV